MDGAGLGGQEEVKREREVARRIWFDRLYLAEQPEDDDIKAHWYTLVILARSFPAQYWVKFVKKHMRQMGPRRERRVRQREGLRMREK
jgi:hypothetical protein